MIGSINGKKEIPSPAVCGDGDFCKKCTGVDRNAGAVFYRESVFFVVGERASAAALFILLAAAAGAGVVAA